MQRLYKKTRIRLLPKQSSHFRNVEIWPPGVSPTFKAKKHIYKITARLEVVELFTRHLLVYLVC